MSTKVKFIIFFILVFWGCSCFFFTCKSSDEAPEESRIIEKPNIIFISIDTLRADRLACYGYEKIKTPNIDFIAKRGVLFTQAICQVPVTLPSHASMFTGLNPTSHNVRENGTFRLDNSERTLAEILKESGYNTAAFIGGFPLDSRFGLDKGFDFYDDDLSDRKDQETIQGKISWQGHKVSTFERKAISVVESAIKWLSSNKESSCFLFIHLFDPHASYSPPAPFKKLYAHQPYDGEVAYVDYCLGKFFKKLEKWKILKDALIIITSDHGESLGEHNYWGHGKKLFEPSLRIPLIISFPSKMLQPKAVNGLVRSIDIMPTILELLDQEKVTEIQGVSLLPLMSDEEEKKLNLASYGETFFPRLRFGEEELRSYRTERWKYIRLIKDNKTVREKLFDLQNDPEEIQDCAKKEEKKTQEFASLLARVIENDRKLAVNKNTFFAMDEETRRKLKSLGYIR
ncbi:MAG: sulfatase [Candidatus Aminicenantes bacterium]|nr:MAG: sulfatase [Candidatus Aminicenantes bacterium]